MILQLQCRIIWSFRSYNVSLHHKCDGRLRKWHDLCSLHHEAVALSCASCTSSSKHVSTAGALQYTCMCIIRLPAFVPFLAHMFPLQLLGLDYSSASKNKDTQVMITAFWYRGYVAAMHGFGCFGNGFHAGITNIPKILSLRIYDLLYDSGARCTYMRREQGLLHPRHLVSRYDGN